MTATAEDVLAWSLKTHGRRVALAWSGGESVAILDMMWKIDPENTRVFTIDTGRLPIATHKAFLDVRKRYGIEIEVLKPDPDELESMVKEKGRDLFYQSVQNRILCCQVRKVRPLNRFLATVDGWITGLRRSEGGARASVKKVEIDEAHGGILKINPLADWTTEEVFEYIDRNDVPKNRLHDLGYPSIGCAPCTRAIRPGEPERAGRWWWEKDEDGPRECGLHFVKKSGR